MTSEPASEESCMSVFVSAASDWRAKRFQESLEKFEWFFENSRNEIAMQGVRLSFALGYWAELANEYSPARDSLANLRDKTETRCREAGGEPIAFYEVSAMNRYLNTSHRTTSLFLEIARQDKEAAQKIYRFAEPYLVAEGLYAECGPFLEIDRTLEKFFTDYQWDQEYEQGKAAEDSPPPPRAERKLRKHVTRLVALLVLNGRAADARLVADQSLAVLASEEFRSQLSCALLGQFPDIA